MKAYSNRVFIFAFIAFIFIAAAVFLPFPSYAVSVTVLADSYEKQLI